MKSLQNPALQRARDYARDRGWRQDPLTWEEVEELVDLASENIATDYRVGFDEGYAAGCTDAEEMITRNDVLDWCSEHGYRLVKEQAS